MHTALIPRAKAEDIATVDQFSREAREVIVAAQKDGNQMTLALATARAVQGLRELVTTDMMADLMSLMNSQLGFATDRDASRPNKRGECPEPYGIDVVKDCFITAQLWGAAPVNNEFNILAGRAYRTVNYYRRKVREIQGVTDVNVQVSTPEYAQVQDGKAARVACVGSWKQDGKQRRIACLKDQTGDWRISVRVNYGMGDDGVKGKAERKLLALMLADMEGRPVEDDAADHDDPSVINGEILGSHVEPAPAVENPGDDLAADAAEALSEHSPAPGPPTSDNPDAKLWLDGLYKKPAKAVSAWVKAADAAGVDITAAADQYLKDLAAKRQAAA